MNSALIYSKHSAIEKAGLDKPRVFWRRSLLVKCYARAIRLL
jgi:hypothetical protein